MKNKKKGENSLTVRLVEALTSKQKVQDLENNRPTTEPKNIKTSGVAR